MALQRRNPGITKGVLRMLADGETQYVDYKKQPNGLHADDLVAFANSKDGGEILLGVSEEKNEDGSQRGVATGCSLDDSTLLAIMNKAAECSPPVSISIIAENTESLPFLRVVVKSSPSKPHSTSSGRYLVRDGSRNRPILPQELLQIFLSSESAAFARKFEEAATAIQDDLANLQLELEQSIRRMGDQLGWTDMKLDDTDSLLGQIQSTTSGIQKDVLDTAQRFRALFIQDERKDPIVEEEKNAFVERLIDQIRREPALVEAKKKGGKFSLEPSFRKGRQLTHAQVEEALEEAFRTVLENEEADSDSTSRDVD